MKNRRAILIEKPVLGDSPIIELQNEYIESLEVLTAFQAFELSTQISPFSFDLAVVRTDGLIKDATVLDVGESETEFSLVKIRDGGPAFHLVNTEKTKTLPNRLSLMSINYSNNNVTSAFPAGILLRINVVEKD